MSHPDATVKPSVGHIRLFGGMDVKGSNVVRVPPPTHPGVGGVVWCGVVWCGVRCLESARQLVNRVVSEVFRVLLLTEQLAHGRQLAIEGPTEPGQRRGRWSGN